jgi:hypothetical protein
MENINIISSEYTLGDISENIIGGSGCVANVAENIIASVGDISDYSMYIYIGIVIIGLLTFVFLYKFYGDSKSVSFQDKLDDCYGDVCHRDL